jgi:hypothetical protein
MLVANTPGSICMRETFRASRQTGAWLRMVRLVVPARRESGIATTAESTKGNTCLKNAGGGRAVTGDEISPLGIIGRQRSTPGQPRLNAP